MMFKIDVYSPQVSNPLPYSKISLLLKDSFAERVKAGMNFGCANFSPNEVKDSLKGAYVIMAIDNKGDIIGILKFTFISVPLKSGRS